MIKENDLWVSTETNLEAIKGYFHSINIELNRMIENHKAVRSELIPLAHTFVKAEEGRGWVVAKALLGVNDLLKGNLNYLNKMQYALSSLKVGLYIETFIRRFFRKSNTRSVSMEYFSWLLEKVIMNLQKAGDSLKIFLMPLLSKDEKVWENEGIQAFVILLNDPLEKITASIEEAESINEFITRFNDKAQFQQLLFMTEIEQKIYETLFNFIPSAALTYKQAVIDLANKERSSYRGVANEFRETLRETLDYFAPDDKVKTQPNFKLEAGKTIPTMKQKARYIIRSQGVTDNATKAPEDALEIIEERIAAFTRATYDRSSISSHVATERGEVQQIKQYTNAILLELLNIKF